ncbi:hypothetical protein QBC44DRAFT_327885 [Cladorrhinum sp. PSN332]|nr:hypothetical protein QBC44DRAFT_327885 [Cladorrhinum sp. PSN332]
MSLGLAQLGRAGPGAAALMPPRCLFSLIPRGRGIPRGIIALNLFIRRRNYSSSNGNNNSGNNKPTISPSSTPTSTWEEISRQEDAAAAAAAASDIDSSNRKSTPSTLVGRLEEIPVRRHGSSETILIKPLARYEGYMETREEVQRYHREMRQQERLSERRGDPNPPDWREILEVLMEWTPKHDRKKIRAKVVLPERIGNGGDELLLRVSDSIWDIPARTGCEMMMAPEEAGNTGDKGHNKTTCLWLTGLAGQLDQALREVLAVTKSITVIRLSDSGDEEAVLADVVEVEGKVKGIEKARVDERVQEFEQWKRDRRTGMFAPRDMIRLSTKKVWDMVKTMQKPTRWTKQNFLDWVIHLTSSKVERGFARMAYEGGRLGRGHQAKVLNELKDVWFDPVASRKATNPALKVTLMYLAKSGVSHINIAHDLYDRAKELGVKMDTRVWNILLEISVRTKDLSGFKARLRKMIAAGFMPSLQTWLLFLRLAQAEEVKRYVIQGIHLKGYLESDWAVQRVSDEMAESDAYRAGRLGLSWEAHLKSLQELYGPRWYFPVSSANKTISQYVRNDRFDEAIKCLEYMFEVKEEDYQKPNTVTLSTFLSSSLTQRRADRALAVLRIFDQNTRLSAVVNELSYHYLFEIAWKLRRPHMLAAVWRYAHLVNQVSGRMRLRGMNMLQGGEAVNRFNIPWHEGATQKQVMNTLLLWDYKQEGWDTVGITEEEEGKEEKEEVAASAAAAVAPDVTKTPVMMAEEAEAVSMLATPENEQPDAMSGGDVSTGLLPKTSPKTISPQVKERYKGFEEWSMGRYLIGAPAVSLSKFLEQAAELDKKLYDEKHKDERRLEKLAPPELPVNLRGRSEQLELLKRIRALGDVETGSERFKAVLKVVEGAAGFDVSV